MIAHMSTVFYIDKVITLVHTVLRHENVKVNTVLILCTVSTILNWVSEFKKWLTDVDDSKLINIYEFTEYVLRIV